MENYSVFPRCFKTETKPSMFCPGCGHPLVLKLLGQVIDELSIQPKTVFLVDIGCSLLAWDFYNVDTTQTHHGRTIPVAVGFKMAKPDSIVLAYVGDGGGYAIGLQNLMNSAIRNNPITTILVNNTNYGMTGGQLAPTTILGEITVTSPEGRNSADQGKPFHGPELLRNIADQSAFIARGTVIKPLILKEYIKKAILNQMECKSFSFVEALSLCPTNWKTNAPETLDFMKKIEEEFTCNEF